MALSERQREEALAKKPEQLEHQTEATFHLKKQTFQLQLRKSQIKFDFLVGELRQKHLETVLKKNSIKIERTRRKSVLSSNKFQLAISLKDTQMKEGSAGVG